MYEIIKFIVNILPAYFNVSNLTPIDFEMNFFDIFPCQYFQETLKSLKKKNPVNKFGYI